MSDVTLLAHLGVNLFLLAFWCGYVVGRRDGSFATAGDRNVERNGGVGR